jgi:hypothetical protein
MDRTVLRACAQAALERRGYKVEALTRPGVISGARLNATKGDQKFLIAVRTSSNRDVTLLRRPDGEWRTIAEVDRVVVAAPAEDDADTVDVFGFKPNEMLELFKQAAAVQRERNSNLSDDLPIRVALDEGRSNGFGKSISGLKNKAAWQKAIPIDDRILELSKKLENKAEVSKKFEKKANAKLGFVERVKREFAELIGVDVSKVTVHLGMKD